MLLRLLARCAERDERGELFGAVQRGQAIFDPGSSGNSDDKPPGGPVRREVDMCGSIDGEGLPVSDDVEPEVVKSDRKSVV